MNSPKKFSVMVVTLGLSLTLITFFVFQNCSPTRFNSIEESSVVQSKTVVTCDFNGKTLYVNDEVEAFLSSTVSAGEACQAEKRKCTNQGLTGSYVFTRCSNLPFSDCPPFDGRVVLHNETVNAHSESAPAYGVDCARIAGPRTCYNGVLLGDSNLKYRSCNPGAPRDCTVGQKTIRHGTSDIFWNKEKSLVGDTIGCLSQSRKCDNSQLDGDASYIYSQCNPEPISNKTINIPTSYKYEPFQVLLIIDDSNTMSANQAKVRSNLDSLLGPLRGMNVRVKVMTTTDASDRKNGQFKFTRSDGTFFNKTADSPWSSENSFPEYLDQNIAQIERLHLKGEFSNSSNIFNLKDTHTQAESTAVIERIKNYISNIGTNGSSSEKVLCPLLRHFENLDANSFYATNRKTAIVVISDEDDSSRVDDCVGSDFFAFGPLSRIQTSPGYQSYDVSVRGVKVTFDYVFKSPNGYKDGILKQPAYQDRLRASTMFGFSALSKASVQDGTCKALAQMLIRELPKEFEPLSQYQTINGEKVVKEYDTSVVEKCEIFEVQNNGGVYSGDQVFNKDYCDLTLKNDSNFSISENINFVRLPSLVGIQLGELVSCTRTNHDPVFEWKRNSITLVDRPNQFFGTLTSTSTNSEFDQYVYSRMQTLFGRNFTMSFLINPADGTCGTTFTGEQSIGQRYENFAKKNSQQIKVFPICSSSYQDALAATSQYVTTNIEPKINMDLPNGANVVGVYLDNTLLDRVKYEIKGQQLTLKLDLLAGQKVKIEYVVR